MTDTIANTAHNPTLAHNPAILAVAEKRPADVQLKIADAITKFAGSIGQNRQAAYQQAKADHDFLTNEQELRQNTKLTEAIHAMTQQLHGRICVDKTPENA